MVERTEIIKVMFSYLQLNPNAKNVLEKEEERDCVAPFGHTPKK